MTQPVSPATDRVSEVIRSFAIRSTILCRSELREPWAFRVEGEPVPKFHLVLEGSALLFIDDDPVLLAAGDLAVLPRGAAHTLADGSATPAVALERLLADHALTEGSLLRYGGTGPLTRVLCGGFALAEGIPDSTLTLFPELIRLGIDPDASPWLAPILSSLSTEAETEQPGASAIVAKIADVFLAQALRAWLLEGERDGLTDIRLIPDETIAKAVRMLNEHPSQRWSLELLAKHVGLSRTALATKFHEQVGEPPIQYLRELRLRRAADDLATGRLSLDQVARRSGYRSEAAFAKAFKRRYALTPGAYRASANRPPRIETRSA
jgi:AraC-like DNA-binding protein